MKKLIVGLDVLFVFVILTVCSPQHANAQTKGLIYKPATGAGASILDPNSDGYTSQDASGFISDDELESEIPFVPLPIIGAGEPDSDLGPGPDCGFTDLVKDPENETAYTYSDGTNLYFRIRLGGTAPNSKGYSIFIDTDEAFGFNSSNPDANAVQGNPGFEVEISLQTNFGVGVYNVDGTTSPTELVAPTTLDYDTYCQKSIALTEICGDDDYFYDFYIPYASLPFTSSDAIRMVAGTVINPNAGTGNNGFSDLAGIDDALGITDDLFEDLIEVFPPTSGDDLSGGGDILPRAGCPGIDAPIAVGATTVTGTSSEADGTTIEVFKDGGSIGTTTVSSGSWTLSGLSPALALGEEITATAEIPGTKSTSIDNCNPVEVGSTCSNVPTSLAIISGTKGVSGAISGLASTSYTLTLYDASTDLVVSGGAWAPSENPVSVTTDGTGAATFNLDCGTGNCLSSGSYYVTAQSASECESDPAFICSGVTGSQTPTISTSPVTTLTTTISGTLDATPTGTATITLYIDGAESGFSTTTTNTSWSISSISGLAVGESITVYSEESGECPTLSSNSVTVQEQSYAPIITGDYCSSSGSISTVNGISSEIGATINLYTGSSPVSTVTPVASTTVASNGSWSISTTVIVGDFMVATATNSGELESDPSSEVEVFSQTVDGSLSITSSPITEGDASISGNGSDGNTIQLYIDDTKIDGFTAVVSSGTWTISGLDEASEGYDVLYAGGVVTVTSQSGSLCEGDQSAGVTVQCSPPASQSFSATSATTVCEDQTITFDLGTENLVVYTLLDQDDNEIGPSVLGDGATQSVTTNGLATTVTSVKVKAERIGVTCETEFGSVSVNVEDLPEITLSSSTLQVCKGETTVDLGYTIDANGPIVDYSIDFDATAEGEGFVDVSNNSTVTNPFVISVPGGASHGTYNAVLTVRNSDLVTCTSSDYAFTISVVDASIGGSSSSNPTTCGGTDGSITLTGFLASTAYTALDYVDDGNTVNHGGFTSDGSGEYEITGLDAGSYTDFEVTLSGCTSDALSGPVVLVDPGGATIAEGTHTQPTNCSSPNGEIVLTGVTTGTYDVEYSFNGGAPTITSIAATASGIAITGLDAGNYTNLSITDVSSCKSNTLAGPIILTNSSSPTITLGSDPEVCAGETSASLTYSGTTNTPDEYDIDFDATAEGEGFVDVVGASLTVSPISITVPGAASVGVYNAVLTVTNTGTGCTSNNYNITVTVNAIPSTPTVNALVTNNTTPTVTGTADVGNSVSVVIAGATYNTTADGLGEWSIDTNSPDAGTFSPNVNGTNEVAVTANNGDCDATDATNNELTIDTTDPATPTVTSQVTNSQGPTITGTFDESDADVFSVTVNSVTYTLGTDTELSNTGDNWTLDLSALTLAEGTYPVTATITDAAGNSVNDATTNELEIDITDPATPTVTSQVTNSQGPTITGTFDESDADVFSVTVNSVTYVLGTDTELSNTGDNWTLDLSALTLAEGTYPVTATITDAAGNSVSDGTTNELEIDITDPATPTVTSQVTNSQGPTITGTFDESDADVFSVTVNSVTYVLGTDTELSNTGDNWTLDLSALTLGEGTYPVTATITDAAGNSVSDGTTNELEIDITDPATPTVTSQVTNSQGPTITGTFDESDADVFSVTVNSVTYTLGTDTELTNTGDNWTLDLSALTLGEGTYPVTATITDAAGNSVNDATTNELEIDITDPATPTVTSQVTNSQGPTITGTFDESDADVFSVTVNSVTYVLGTDTELSNTGDNWTLDLSALTLAEGTYPVTATITDAAGNSVNDATTNELEIDITDPATPTVTSQVTNSQGPTITGTFDESDADVFSVTVNSVTYVLGTDTELSNTGDNWTLDLSALTLAEGTYPVTATITDAAGNSVSDGTTNELEIDITDPATPTVTSQVTNSQGPTITGTFDESDADVFSVTVNSVTYTLGTDTELTNTGDSWTLDLSALTLGEGTYPVTATITDAAGNSVNDATTNELEIDITDPATPTVTSQVTNSQGPTITGTFDESDADVFSVTVNSVTYVLGTDTELSNTGDNWTLDLSALTLAEGTYPVTATITDAAGNSVSDGTTNELEIDITDPATPTVTSQVTNSQGPTITGTFDESDADVFSVTVNSVTYTLGTDTELTNTGDSWTLDLSALTLGEGTYPVTATITDAAGNSVNDATTNELEIDITDPATPTVTSQVTNSQGPTITGTFDESDADVFSVTVNSVTYTLGTDTELSNTGDNWTLDLSALTLAEGTYPVTATITDAAGNSVSDGTTNELEIDITDPATPTVTSQVTNSQGPTITGTFDESDADVFSVTVNSVTYTLGTDTELTNTGDSWTLDLSALTLGEGTYPVTATITDAAGNSVNDATTNELEIDITDPATPTVTSQVTNSQGPTITGTFDESDADVFSVTVNSVTYTLGTDTELSNTGDNWTLDLSALTLAEGTYPVTATITDAAGNSVSDATTNELEIDITDPATPTVVSQITNSQGPTITGTFDESDADVFSVTVNSVTYVLGTDTELSNTGDNWTLDLSALTLAEGTYPVTATITDAAGNSVSDATTNELEIDITDPATPTVVSQITNSQGPTITGTFDESDADVFSVTVNSVTYTLGTDTELSNTGDNWTLDLSALTLGEGTYPVTATITDAAGNSVSDATTNELEIDITDPATPTVVSQITNSQGPTITGTFDESDADIFSVTVNSVTYILGTDTELSNTGDNWTLDLSALTLGEGTYPVTATITDAAGNSVSDATTNELEIDITDPATPTVVSQITNSQGPTITGTFDESDADVFSVTINSVTYTLGTDTELTNTGDSWTLDLSALTLGEGTYPVTATITDAAGNSVSDATTNELEIDITDPATPTVISQITNSQGPTITGTFDESDADVFSVTINSVTYTLGTDTELSNTGDSWTLDLSALTLGEGTYPVTATITDAAGNSVSDATTNELEIDITDPATPTVVSQITNSQGPTITGTFDESDADIFSVTVNSVTYVLGTDTELSNTGDNWTLDLSALTLGEGTYPVTATITDAAGNSVSDATTDELEINLTGPSVPTVNSILTNETSPVITGTADAGTTVTVEVGGATFSTTADVSGNWSIDTSSDTPTSGTFTPLSEGGNEVVVTSTDSIGNSTQDTTTDEITIDTTAPSIPTVNSLTTNDTTPVISGTGEPGTTMTVEIGGATYSVVADVDGNWSIDTETDTPTSGTFNPLTEGNYDVVVTSTDDAGNSSTDATVDEITFTNDTDGDGILDEDEDLNGDDDLTNDDCDNDGTPNYLDTDPCDSDGDGLDDGEEDTDGDGNPYNDDCDNDGTPNFQDADSCDTDGDGILDEDEDLNGDDDLTNDDCDNDGTPNYLDTDPCDSDGDGLDDGEEDTDGDGNPYNDDCDNDGTPNFQDADSCDTDGDGILDEDEDLNGDDDLTNDDCDNDGTPNYLDTDPCDSDGDGLDDGEEDTDGDGNPYNDDCDNDGTPNFQDADSCDTDGDGILDEDEDLNGDDDLTNDDCDNDGTPNYLDTDPCDSDGDGLDDGEEDTDGDGNPYNDDCDNDGTPNFQDADSCDTDGDGILDEDEDLNGDDDLTNDDCDNDGTPNYLDTDPCDSDGDGLDDGEEDTDGDGNPYNDDCDNDGTPNFQDADSCDTDGDGILDEDEDLNGDDDLTNDDCDNDGTPNYLDTDPCDSDGDGLDDGEEDTDGDGNPYNDDCDNDGTPNFQDADSCDTDGDGILDEDEDLNGDDDLTNDDCDNDGTPNYLDTDPCDSDGDGLDDGEEDTDGDGNPYNDDCDNDGTPNFQDADSCDTDGDGILDEDEDLNGDDDLTNDDCDNDGTPNYLDTDPCDSDGDGLDDGEEDTDGDGNPYNDDCDNDGTPNFQDADSCDTDGDGILDEDEDLNGDDDLTNDDCDNDGTPNYLDTDPCDSDGDGLDDGEEDADGDGNPYNDDCDNDGTPNFQDADSCDTDGDGILDEDEDLNGDDDLTNDDCDNDGTPNYLDTDPCDSDGDGLDDGEEDTDGDGNPYNDDCDNDGTPNFQDADSCDTDGDGILDEDEDLNGDDDLTNDDCDNDGTPNYLDTDPCDSDGDGLDDGEEDTDGDGNPYNDDCDEDDIPNFLDPDSCSPDDTSDVTPNKGFTPDGDGINDAFYIENIEQYPNNRVQIFNRWGNKVFETAGYDNQSNNWSGQSNVGLIIGATDVPDGTYYYMIDLGDGSKPMAGFVVINR